MKRYLAILLALVLCFTLLAGCKTNTDDGKTSPTPTEPGGIDPADTTGFNDPKFYTYNDYLPSFGVDWNPHTWTLDVESTILDYLSSGLYAFKFNDDQTAAELYPLAAAADPIDVTSKLTADQKAKYGIPASATDSYAWQYPLNQDAAFEDGTAITAQLYADSLELLLDPARANGRAMEQRVGEAPIAGADGYYNQGKISKVAAVDDSDTVNNKVYLSYTNAITWWGDTWQSAYNSYYSGGYPEYFTSSDGVDLYKKWGDFVAANGGWDGGYFLLEGDALKEFETDWTEVCLAVGGGYEGEWKEFVFISGQDFTDPKYSDFGNVGIIVDDEYTVTFVYGKKVTLFNAKYYQTSTWLVHPALYEQYSKLEGELLTTSYMTGVDSSISYGPYTLKSYEPDKEMLFVRNETWFGYTDAAHLGMYQADQIRIRQIAEQSTALLSFLKGELDTATLVATDLVEYGTSDYLQVMPNTYLYRVFYDLGLADLQALDKNGDANSNTVALTNKSFRLALSVAIDRNEYTKITNRVPAFAMMNDLYTYDYEGEMADGARYRYRDLDIAKEAILNIYDIKYGAGTEYPTLDIAVDSVTGYDPALAAELFKTAFEELSAGAASTGFDPSKPVHILIGFSPSSISPTALASQNELNRAFAAAAAGSGFAGVEFEFVVDSDRYTAVTDGRLAASIGAVGGARQDPWGISRAFLDASYSIYLGSNIPNDQLELTYDWDENPATPDETIKQSLYEWYVALTDTYFEASIDLKGFLLASLESYYLKQGYTTALESGVDTALTSIRVSYPIDEYDPIIGFGGLPYAKFSLDDTEWTAYIAQNTVNGSLQYK
jgi:ABC-type transport system substrate-binding protein